MCVLWFLLQLVVMFLYWDLPLQGRGNAEESVPHGSTDAEDGKGQAEEEEDTDEEKPLITSQELVGSYGSVAPPNTQAASNAALNHTSLPSPKPQDSDTSSRPGFFSLRGGWEAMTLKFYISGNSRLHMNSLSVEFLREEVIVLLAAQFITLFNQTALEV